MPITMAKRAFPLIQRGLLPQGDSSYEKKREGILQQLYDSIPEDLWISQNIIDNPPLDVTGIPRSCGLLTEEQLEITENHDAVSLAEAISTKKYTAVSVTRAFAKRAAIAHQITCCLTQFFMDEALERAKELDDYLAQHGKPIGPLHGVPVSIKEHIPIANHYSSWGLVSSTTKSTTDCLMVSILRAAGAIFYVKTNQPQYVIHLETDSHHGRTLNPYNINLSAGGSTGGEAALIALKASVLGVGTDIGGSIRAPSAFTGIFGFKPTSYILTTQDYNPAGFAAELNILGSTGPMCRSLRDVDLFMHTVISSKQFLYDPRIIPLPWTGLSSSSPLLPSSSSSSPLKVGIMFSDGVMTPHPAITRGLKWAQQLLSSSSASNQITLKPYTAYKAAEALSLIHQYYWPDNALPLLATMKSAGEPIFPLTEHIISYRPSLTTNTTSTTTTSSSSQQNAEEEKELTASQILAQRVSRDHFRSAFTKHWNSSDVDVVICPGYVGPASKHGEARYWGYTALWNFVDYPAAVIPTPLRVGDDLGEREGEGWEGGEETKEEKRGEVGKETDYKGAPIALQVVGRRYCDDGLMKALGVLQGILGFA